MQYSREKNFQLNASDLDERILKQQQEEEERKRQRRERKKEKKVSKLPMMFNLSGPDGS